MRKLAFLLLCSLPAAAQFTTVSGTITDPNTLPYAYGTISAVLVSSASPIFTSTNLPYFPPTQPVGLSSTGAFVMQLADNTQLTPGGSQYSFAVCSGTGTVQPSFGKGSVCFIAGPITISGSSQSITATLTAAAKPLTVNFGGGGSVSGSGTTNFIPIWTGSATLGNSIMDSGGGGGNIRVNASGASNSTFPFDSILAPTLACNLTTTTLPFISFSNAQGCMGAYFAFTGANNASTNFGATAGAFFLNTTNQFSTTLRMGVYAQSGANDAGGVTTGTNLGVYGRADVSASGGTTLNQGIFGFGNGGSTGTNPTNDGIAAQTGDQGATTTNDSSMHVLSPSLTGASVLTHHWGIKIEDQTVAGTGTNSDPHGIVELGTAPNAFGGLTQPPINAVASLPACTASTEGAHAVANNCNAACSAGGTCTSGGATHCELYCGTGSAYVETGR